MTKLSRKSETAVAISYVLARWPALLRFCGDGRLEIENNEAERALRAVALGRKNYLVAGSDSGGQRAAAIYGLIGSARLNASIPKPICVTYLHVLPIIQSSASPICCHGTSRPHSPLQQRSA